MKNGLLKVGRVVVGVAGAVVAAEVVAIGLNAGFDDVTFIANKIHPVPEPVKKGLFGRVKKVK